MVMGTVIGADLLGTRRIRCSASRRRSPT